MYVFYSIGSLNTQFNTSWRTALRITFVSSMVSRIFSLFLLLLLCSKLSSRWLFLFRVSSVAWDSRSIILQSTVRLLLAWKFNRKFPLIDFQLKNFLQICYYLWMEYFKVWQLDRVSYLSLYYFQFMQSVSLNTRNSIRRLKDRNEVKLIDHRLSLQTTHSSVPNYQRSHDSWIQRFLFLFFINPNKLHTMARIARQKTLAHTGIPFGLRP